MLRPASHCKNNTSRVVTIHLILAKIQTLYQTLKLAKNILNLDYQTRRTSCFYDTLIAQTIYAQLRSYFLVPEAHEKELEKKILLIIQAIVGFHGIPGYYDFSNADINPLPIIDPILLNGQHSGTIAAYFNKADSTVQHAESHHRLHDQRIQHSIIRVPVHKDSREEPNTALSK
jgi:hypothetical protein